MRDDCDRAVSVSVSQPRNQGDNSPLHVTRAFPVWHGGRRSSSIECVPAGIRSQHIERRTGPIAEIDFVEILFDVDAESVIGGDRLRSFPRPHERTRIDRVEWECRQLLPKSRHFRVAAFTEVHTGSTPDQSGDDRVRMRMTNEQHE